MSAPLPNALRVRFQRYIAEGLSGRAAGLRHARHDWLTRRMPVTAGSHSFVRPFFEARLARKRDIPM